MNLTVTQEDGGPVKSWTAKSSNIALDEPRFVTSACARPSANAVTRLMINGASVLDSIDRIGLIMSVESMNEADVRRSRQHESTERRIA